MESRAPATAVDGADGLCPSVPPVLVTVDLVPEPVRADLLDAARACDCRVYEAVDARPGSFVIAGSPDDLGSLRNRLVPTEALDFAREAVERVLALTAAPDGLPQFEADDYRKRKVAAEKEVPEGTTLLVTREFTFDAAHNLPRYNGKCEHLHGHTFKLEVTVRSPLDTWSGMAFDFHDLKKTVMERVVDVLDHSYMNEIIPNPSAEYTAIWCWERLSDLPLHEIKIWETPTSHVTYQGPPKREPPRPAGSR